MTTQPPFFSVIIPLYNKENFIVSCVQSVLAQQFSLFEIILVDDGSTDDSLQKISQLKDDRIVLEQQPNLGAGAARNRGVQLAKSPWIAFLDADDYWKNNHLSELYKAIVQFPEEVVFTSRLSRLLHKREVLADYGFPIEEKISVLRYFVHSVKSDLLNTSGVCINKDFFTSLGGFNTTIYSGQDTDLFIRIGLQKDIVFIPQSTFVYNQQSENNISLTPRFKERLAMIDAYEELATNHPALKKYLDLNRFSIFLRAKIHGDPTWQQALVHLDKKNLTTKQWFLMKLPKILLINLKRFQLFMMRWGIKKSAF